MTFERAHEILVTQNNGTISLLDKEGLNFLQFLYDKGHLDKFTITINKKPKEFLFEYKG